MLIVHFKHEKDQWSQIKERFCVMSRSAKLIISLQRPKDPGVHLPHCLLCVNRDRPVGGLDHLQDQEELSVPAGDEERDAQLWALLRNPAGRFSVLLPRHGQGAQDVSSEGNSKALCVTSGLLSLGVCNLHSFLILTIVGKGTFFPPVISSVV